MPNKVFKMKKNSTIEKYENENVNENLKEINYKDEILTFNDKQKKIILLRYIKELKKINKIEISINDYINQYSNLNNDSSDLEKSQILYCINCMKYIDKDNNENHDNHIIKKIEEIKPVQEEFDLLNEIQSKLKDKCIRLKSKKKNIIEKMEKKYTEEKELLDKRLKEIMMTIENENKNKLNIIYLNYMKDIFLMEKKYQNTIRIMESFKNNIYKLIKNKYNIYKKNLESHCFKIINDYKKENEEKLNQLNINYENGINNLDYDKKLKDIENILSLNDIILNSFKVKDNSYFNIVNINNLCLYYINNETYTNIIKNKFNENFKNLKETIVQKSTIKIDKDFIKHKYLANNEIQFNNKKVNIMTLLYKVDKTNIKLFHKLFVYKNKKKCEMIINGKRSEIKEIYKCNKNEIYKNINGSKYLEVILEGKLPISNMSYMFSECDSLSPFSDLSKWNTSNVNNMSFLFSECSNLISLPDISKWDISNVKDMNQIFNNCSSLISLPDISKWNTKNIISIYGFLDNCSSLKNIPDISNWNTSNFINVNKFFNNCSSLITIPDISKWDISNVKDISYLFSDCSSLKSLPDISIWNTKNVLNMKYLFNNCSKLSKLPDLSKWDTKNVYNMRFMFGNCCSLNDLCDISKWDISNVKDVDDMFSDCNSLKYLPDISQWNTSNVKVMSDMFNNCSSLISIPDISKWNIKNVNLMNNMFSNCINLESIPDFKSWDTSHVADITGIFYNCPKTPKHLLSKIMLKKSIY